MTTDPSNGGLQECAETRSVLSVARSSPLAPRLPKLTAAVRDRRPSHVDAGTGLAVLGAAAAGVALAAFTWREVNVSGAAAETVGSGGGAVEVKAEGVLARAGRARPSRTDAKAGRRGTQLAAVGRSHSARTISSRGAPNGGRTGRPAPSRTLPKTTVLTQEGTSPAPPPPPAATAPPPPPPPPPPLPDLPKLP
jgi:hypothetical protein